MKKIFTIVLSCLVIGISGVYVYSSSTSASINDEQQRYEVPFEDSKLIKSEVDEKTGVKMDVYTIEGWE